MGNAEEKEALVYDADGNLTRKGVRTFRWDAENRLVEVRERGDLVARYAYDHLSRRIARWTRDGVDERYLYQGWNLIAVYAPDEIAPTETFTWGRDMSGSLQGAGGVGGLLFAKTRQHGQDAWIYHYDGNGNVTEVTDSKGAVLDRYAYDPFGQLSSSPPKLPQNRWRFSTKVQDDETAFYYYGHRYYDSQDGRWLSRDPIGERGGLNLYGFVGNDPVNRWDYLGLVDPDDPGGPGRPGQQMIPGNRFRPSADEISGHAIRDFVRGTKNNSRTYGPDSPWTQHLAKEPNFERLRAWVKKTATTYCKQGTPADLTRKNPPRQWDHDAHDRPIVEIAKEVLSDLLTYADFKSGVDSTGSYDVNFWVDSVDCCRLNAEVRFQVLDSLRLSSGLHIPKTNFPPRGINEPFGPGKPFNNIELEFKWKETISLKP